MVLRGRPVAWIAALTIALAASSPEARAQSTTIEVYPGPGVDTYRSSLYTVEAFDGTSWIPAYVYQFGRKSVTYWWTGASPSVSFVTFGASGPVQVRVGRIGGSIAVVDVSPKNKVIHGQLSGGRAVGTLNPNDKLWLTINGDDANPLFLFADPLKPAVPPGATYFGPGVRDIAPAAGNHYKASSNELIYLDGGAWVRGNIDVRGSRGVRVMGPGVLSGDLWKAEDVGASALPFDQFLDYAMITGDFYAGNGAEVDGITIVDSPGYNFFGGATRVTGVKVLSPWFYSTDGFQGVSHVDQVFCFNGDNVFSPGWAGVQNDDMTFTRSFVANTENSVFAGGYWGNAADNTHSALAEDIDVRTYTSDAGGPPLVAGIFQVWVDNAEPSKGYRNQTYQNIRIENVVLSVPMMSLKNVVYPWGGPTAVSPPLGNSSNLMFRNIRFAGTQKYRSEIKGWDAGNGFHNVVLDGVTMGGDLVTAANLSRYFDVNAFVSGLQLGPGASCAADATTMCLSNGRFQVRATYDSGTASGNGQAVALTGDTGFFWFFSPANVEIIVKVLNACGVNQNFWVFAGGLTNVGVNLAVTDTQTGTSHTYTNARGATFLPLQRTGDFGVCP